MITINENFTAKQWIRNMEQASVVDQKLISNISSATGKMPDHFDVSLLSLPE